MHTLAISQRVEKANGVSGSNAAIDDVAADDKTI
jgi:hypothetical protein